MKSSAFDREAFIASLLTSMDKRIINNAISPLELTDLIIDALSPIIIDIEENFDADVPVNYVVLGADYAEWEDVKITMYLSFHMDQLVLTMAEQSWTDLKNRIICVILHEFHHDEQYRKRGGRKQREPNRKEMKSIRNMRWLEDSMYMAHPDEVDAYAMSASIGIRQNSDPKQLKSCVRVNTIGRRYQLLFKQESTVRKKFFKKLYLNLKDDK